MPQRSKVITLPEEILAELNQKLLTGKFCDYTALAEWLQAQGYDISRSSLHRYGQDFEERLSAITMATEQARAVAEASKDDEGHMNESLIRLVQTKAFEVLIKAESDENLPKMGVMIAKLSKASVDQKKWMAEMKKKTAAALSNIEKKTEAGGKKSLDPETLRIIREEIYGITG